MKDHHSRGGPFIWGIFSDKNFNDLRPRDQSLEFLKNNKLNEAEKKTLFKRGENQTTMECEKTLFELFPDKNSAPKPREHKRRVSAQEVRLTLTFKEETLEKLERLKALKKTQDQAALIDEALELLLTKCDPTTVKRQVKRKAQKTQGIPAAVRREVFKRAKNRCEYPGCGEIHYLEVDHVRPQALGGGHQFSNLRLYCRTHNQRGGNSGVGAEKDGAVPIRKLSSFLVRGKFDILLIFFYAVDHGCFS